MYNFPYLQDTEFLKNFDKSKIKEQFINIVVLDNKDNFIQNITGRTIGGSINLTGDSAMRRTATIQLIADDYKNDLTNINNTLSINKRVEILIGFTNFSNQYKEFPILWFPQGIFLIVGANIQHGMDGISISLTLHDKMALLNGECGGVFPANINFHEMEDQDEFGNVTISKPTIKQIIMELVNHWGQEQQGKIIINNLEDKVKQVLKWNGNTDTKFYVYNSSETSTSIASSSYIDILQQCFKVAYKKLGKDKLPKVNDILDYFTEDISKKANIDTNRDRLNYTKSILENIEKQESILDKEKNELSVLQDNLNKHYRTPPKNIINLLNALSDKFQTFFIKGWQQPYKEWISEKINSSGLNELSKENQIQQKIRYIITETRTLKNKVALIKNHLNTATKEIQWVNKKGETKILKINYTPEDCLAALLMLPQGTTMGLNKDFEGLSFTMNDWDTKPTRSNFLKILDEEIKNLKNQTKRTPQQEQKLSTLNSFKKLFKEYTDANTNKAVLARTAARDNQVQLYIYQNKQSKKYLFKKISKHNMAALNIAFFNTLYSNDNLLKKIKKGQINYDSFYYCFPKLLEIISMFSPTHKFRKQIDDKLIARLTKIYNDKQITAIEVEKICQQFISICDNILVKVEGQIQPYYDNLLQNWKDIRTQALSEKMFSNKTQTFKEILKNSLDTLKKNIDLLPVQTNYNNNKVNLRQEGQNLFQLLNAEINQIIEETENYKFEAMPLTQIYTKIQFLFSTNTKQLGTNSVKPNARNIKVRYRDYFNTKKFRISLKEEAYYQKLEQLNNQLIKIKLNMSDYLKQIYYYNFQNCFNNSLILQKQFENINKLIDIPNSKTCSSIEKQLAIMNDEFLKTISSTLNELNDKNKKNVKEIDLLLQLETPKIEQLKNQIKAIQELQVKSNINENPIQDSFLQLIQSYNNLSKQLKQQDSQENMANLQTQINEFNSILKKEIQNYQNVLNVLITEQNKLYIQRFKTMPKNCFEKALTKAMSKISNGDTQANADGYASTLQTKFYKIYTEERAKIQIFNSGQDIGYTLVDFYYPGTLTANAGQTVVSVLDKIKNLLGNYEYYYDINGNFIFQEVKNYINTSYATEILSDNISPVYDYNTSSRKCIYDFSTNEIIQSYANSPQYQNIKNDFVVWGERKTASGNKFPIRYHLAIDGKNSYNTAFFLDAPQATTEIYDYLQDFPQQGDVSKIYYAKRENKFYQWFQEKDSSFVGYKIYKNLILSKWCKHFLTEEDFPKFSILNSNDKKYYYYAQNSDNLYRCGQHDYILTPAYRIKTCPTLNDLTQRYNLVNNKYYYIQSQKAIYKYKNNQFQKTYYKPYTAKDYRTSLFLEGIVNEITGINSNYYYTELKNQWLKIYDIFNNRFYYSATKHNLSQMDFFLDLLLDNFEQYNITNIGRRTKVISNNAINCIFQPECPEHFFLDKNPPINLQQSSEHQQLEKLNYEIEKNNFINLFSEWKQNQKLNDTAQIFQVSHEDYINIVNGGTLRSAYEEIRSMLNQELSYNEQISLVILPIYYLEPNRLIYVNDPVSDINGNYLIKSFSIPLDISANMTLSCAKIIDKI